MKKNVVFLVLDSFIYYKLGKKTFGPSPTPFLDKLVKESLICTNLYSQGPFTESGNKALLTGSDSLDNGGYMHNLNDSENRYLDVFKKGGYETFEFFLPFYMYSQKDFDNMDHQYFTCDFMFDSVYSNRISYFGEIQKTRPLFDYEYEDIYRQLDLSFQAWKNFLAYKDLSRYKCIERIVEDFDWKGVSDLLKKEEFLYENNKKDYADSVMKEGKKHALYQIPVCKLNKYLDEDFINSTVFNKKYKSFFNASRNKQIFGNLRNQPYRFWHIFPSLWASLKNKKLQGYAKSVAFTILSYKLMQAYKKDRFYQQLPSMRHCTDVMIEELAKRDSEKPFFVHLHPEELHNRASFFTFDMNVSEYIDEEFGVFENYLNNLSKDWKGQLLYDYALLYTDLTIKHMFEKLESMGLLKNTVVAICADHGCSYDCVPLRENFVNNHHTENYHIPFILYDGSDPKHVKIDSYHTSKDVLPTIYKMVGLDIPSNITGKPVDAPDNQTSYAISEYMGGGCPDMIGRPIQFMIRDKDYLVCYNVKMVDEFETGEIEEIYNLQNDPLELKNLINDRASIENIKYLLDILKKRHQYIRNSFYAIHPNYPMLDNNKLS